MPSTRPLDLVRLGPSTTAPSSSGGPPFREPIRLVTWCCMQLGKRLPSPTASDTPQAFAPSTLASQRLLWLAKLEVPDSWSYSLAITDRPKPCEAVSNAAHGKPNRNGS